LCPGREQPTCDTTSCSESDDRPHPRHFATVDAADDADARRLVAEKWGEFRELRLLLVRNRLVTVPLGN
jgi:hypothetical protein